MENVAPILSTLAGGGILILNPYPKKGEDAEANKTVRFFSVVGFLGASYLAYTTMKKYQGRICLAQLGGAAICSCAINYFSRKTPESSVSVSSAWKIPVDEDGVTAWEIGGIIGTEAIKRLRECAQDETKTTLDLSGLELASLPMQWISDNLSHVKTIDLSNNSLNWIAPTLFIKGRSINLKDNPMEEMAIPAIKYDAQTYKKASILKDGFYQAFLAPWKECGKTTMLKEENQASRIIILCALQKQETLDLSFKYLLYVPIEWVLENLPEVTEIDLSENILSYSMIPPRKYTREELEWVRHEELRKWCNTEGWIHWACRDKVRIILGACFDERQRRIDLRGLHVDGIKTFPWDVVQKKLSHVEIIWFSEQPQSHDKQLTIFNFPVDLFKEFSSLETIKIGDQTYSLKIIPLMQKDIYPQVKELKKTRQAIVDCVGRTSKVLTLDGSELKENNQAVWEIIYQHCKHVKEIVLKNFNDISSPFVKEVFEKMPEVSICFKEKIGTIPAGKYTRESLDQYCEELDQIKKFKEELSQGKCTDKELVDRLIEIALTPDSKQLKVPKDTKKLPWEFIKKNCGSIEKINLRGAQVTEVPLDLPDKLTGLKSLELSLDHPVNGLPKIGYLERSQIIALFKMRKELNAWEEGPSESERPKVSMEILSLYMRASWVHSPPSCLNLTPFKIVTLPWKVMENKETLKISRLVLSQATWDAIKGLSDLAALKKKVPIDVCVSNPPVAEEGTST